MKYMVQVLENGIYVDFAEFEGRCEIESRGNGAMIALVLAESPHCDLFCGPLDRFIILKK